MTSVLIVGSGAREHALAWKLRQSPEVDRLYVAPGNAGTRLLAENVPIAATDLDGIVRFVEERQIDLTVVGPEAPLALGLANRLRAIDRLVVGPDAAAARIESSKAFAKEIMRRAGVPTARYCVYDDPAHAFRHLLDCCYPVVIKADGLAAGKGVVVAEDAGAARAAVEAMMIDRVYGSAGERIVIEEALQGPEVSLLALVDGEHVAALPVAQDHKRLLDGNRGPNTGGMGAYAPVPHLDPDEVDSLVDLVITPVVRCLADRGIPYRGFIFAGLMLTEDGPMVLEYNCRLGDPETQVVLPLIEGDLLSYLIAVSGEGRSGCDTLLRKLRRIPTRDKKAVGVVLATPGYPEKPDIGAPIEGLDVVSDDLLVFHAGTALDAGGRVVTAGGRVLTVVGMAASLEEAAAKAYTAPIYFEGMQRREDIGFPLTPSPDPGDGAPGLQIYRGEGSNAFSPPRPDIPVAPILRDRGLGLGGEGSRIAVLTSGNGSNLQALIGARAMGELDSEIAVVVSHNPDAYALQRARDAGIPAYCTELRDRLDRAERLRMEERILCILEEHEVGLVVLAGWMLILSAEFLDRCRCPVINVHPALLDRFPIIRGAHAVRDALRDGVPHTGVTVHLVTPEVDAGPVLLSEVVSIHQDDDEETLYRRIKLVEHRLLPQAVNQMLSTVSPGGVYA